MEFSKLMEERRSVRSYRKATVTKEQILEMAKAAVQAPSWKNTETGRYYIVMEPEKVAKFRAECLPGFNQASTENCSAYIVATFQKGIAGFKSSGEKANTPGNEWGAYDLGLQNAYLLLKARELGLDSLIMGLYDEAGVRAFCGIPENEDLMPVIAIGCREGEPALRERKQPEEILHFVG